MVGLILHSGPLTEQREVVTKVQGVRTLVTCATFADSRILHPPTTEPGRRAGGGREGLLFRP